MALGDATHICLSSTWNVNIFLGSKMNDRNFHKIEAWTQHERKKIADGCGEIKTNAEIKENMIAMLVLLVSIQVPWTIVVSQRNNMRIPLGRS